MFLDWRRRARVSPGPPPQLTRSPSVSSSVRVYIYFYIIVQDEVACECRCCVLYISAGDSGPCAARRFATTDEAVRIPKLCHDRAPDADSRPKSRSRASSGFSMPKMSPKVSLSVAAAESAPSSGGGAGVARRAGPAVTSAELSARRPPPPPLPRLTLRPTAAQSIRVFIIFKGIKPGQVMARACDQ